MYKRTPASKVPTRVTSVLANTAHDNAEVEDLSMSILEYPGALAVVTASVVDHGEDQALIFQCEKAKIAFPYSVFASQPQPNAGENSAVTNTKTR